MFRFVRKVSDKSGLGVFTAAIWRGFFALVTLAEVQQLRDDAYAAYRAVLSAQSYTIAERSLQRAKLAELAQELAKWDRTLAGMKCGRGGGLRVTRFVPRDL